MGRRKHDHDSIDNYMEYGIDIEGRTIFMDQDVDEISVGQVMKALRLMDRVPSEEPIKLIVNSFGGSVYDGLALYDAIRNTESDVHTYGYGKIMSMATYIFIAGDKRFISKNSTIMIHEISDWMVGMLEDLKIAMKEAKRLEDLLVDIYVKRTSEKNRKYWARIKRDTYFTAQDALKKGMADFIIGEDEEE